MRLRKLFLEKADFSLFLFFLSFFLSFFFYLKNKIKHNLECCCPFAIGISLQIFAGICNCARAVLCITFAGQKEVGLDAQRKKRKEKGKKKGMISIKRRQMKP